MFARIVVVIAVTLVVVCSFQVQNAGVFSKWLRRTIQSQDGILTPKNVMHGSISWTRISMSSEEVDVGVPEAPVDDAAEASTTPNDFSQYAPGQQYDGTVISSRTFGVFVDISRKPNVLVPRSFLSKFNFDKLTKLAEEKSKEIVKIELVGVSAQNQTLSAKLVTSSKSNNGDFSVLVDKDKNARYNATIVSTHEFGVFANIDEFGIDGLVPLSLLPEFTSGSIKSQYPVGSKVVVAVQRLLVDEKKLTLTMKFKDAVEESEIDEFSKEKWIQGVVQTVTNFGLFVRPAGSDASGLVHVTRVPRDLISTLSKRVTAENPDQKTDFETLFQVGDVVKVRKNSLVGGKLGLSMLPYRADDEDEDDYVVEGRDSPEDEEKDADDDQDDDADDEKDFDAESVLLWWRGKPFEKTVIETGDVADEEVSVVNENSRIVEGTWRRMFEIDMREDAADFSSKALEAELKELEEEIGELNGLDEQMVDSLGLGVSFSDNRFGSFVSQLSLPEEWKAELGFFKEQSDALDKKTSGLRAGKASELSEFEKMMKEVEVEMDQAASRSRRRGDGEDAPAGASDVEAVAAPVEMSSSAEPVEAA